MKTTGIDPRFGTGHSVVLSFVFFLGHRTIMQPARSLHATPPAFPLALSLALVVAGWTALSVHAADGMQVACAATTNVSLMTADGERLQREDNWLAVAWQPPEWPTQGSGFVVRAQDASGLMFEEAETANGGPEHIRDNAFLVEEAFNQEPGVVQHIFNWITLWDDTPQGRTRDFATTYTMELPLFSQTHQFSFTTEFVDAFEKPSIGPAEQQGGVGDTFLNYRYQLLADDDFLWVAPRFSLIVPTGDERFGLGTGKLGYQFNLPISKYGERFDLHFNAGLTHTPDVSVPLGGGFFSPRHDLRGHNLGASIFYKPQTYFHVFVEALALWDEEIDELGSRDDVTHVFVNPGARYAVCQFDEVEWVLGVAVPVGLTSETPDIGLFAYMSVEHAFLKVANGQ